MKHIILLIILLLNILNSYSTIQIRGKVINYDSGESIPFVNIAIPGTFYGTITNQEGIFYLSIPEKYSDKQLIFSYIGFYSDTIIITDINTYLIVKLKPAIHEIKEVTVMPDNTLNKLLKKAYEKIPENYPDRPSRYQGFYRSSIKLNEGAYIYFTEALLNIFKDSYSKRNGIGQTNILKSRRYYMPEGDSIFPIGLYGGVQMPIWNDPVYNVATFINPKHFKYYIYTVEDNLRYNDREVLCISFTPNPLYDKETKEGKFYIDKSNLSYIYFEYKLTPKGISVRNSKLKHGLMSKERNFKMLFDWYYQKCYLKGIWDKEIFEYKNKQFCNTDEYLTTEVFLDSVAPIPYNEQAPLRTVISREATDYYNTDWRNYTQIERDSVFMRSAGFEKNTEANRILSYSKPKTELTSGEKLRLIISKIYIDYGIGFSNYISDAQNITIKFEPQPGNVFFSHKKISNLVYNYYVHAKIAYKFDNSWRISFSSFNGLNNHLSQQSGIQIEYHTCIKNIGRQWFSDFSMGLANNKFGYYIDEYENKGTFEMNGKKIKSEKIKLYSGFVSYAIVPEMSISTQWGNFTKLVAAAGYKVPVHTNHLLFIRESSGFSLLRKTGNTDLDTKIVDYYINTNKVLSKKSGFGLNGLYINVGIRFDI